MKIQEAFKYIIKEDPFYDEVYKQYQLYKEKGGTLLDAHDFLKLFTKDYNPLRILNVEKKLIEKNKTQKKSKAEIKKQLMDEFL